jgi:hypothetical protein
VKLASVSRTRDAGTVEAERDLEMRLVAIDWVGRISDGSRSATTCSGRPPELEASGDRRAGRVEIYEA